MVNSRTHFVTVSGQPPNGGVPPGVAFRGRPSTTDNTPLPAYKPTPMVLAGPPPPAYRVPVAAPAPPPPPAPAPAAAAPTPPPFEPPGARLNGETFVHDGKAYLFPAEHVVIHFFHEGHRPFENPGVANNPPPFQALRVPTTTTVADLMRQLGTPQDDGANDRYGVTECIEAGNGNWEKGTTYVLSQDRSKKMLKDVRWGVDKPVWITVFDSDRHFL